MNGHGHLDGASPITPHRLRLQASLQSMGGVLALRIAHAAAGIFYAVVFRLVYDIYISPIYGYSGLRDRQSSMGEILFSWGCIASVSAILPLRIDRPSGVFVWMLYAFVYVPTLSLTFVIGLNDPAFYIPSLLALTAAFGVIAGTSQMALPRVQPHTDRPLRNLGHALLILLFVSSAILWIKFHGIMTFAGVRNVYFQRFAASEASNGFFGYVRTYYNFILGSGLIAVGLARHRPVAVILGVGSFFFTYMIDAQKVSLIIPAWCFSVFIISRYTKNLSIFYTTGLAVIVALSSLFGRSTSFFRFILDLILVRSIAIPGQSFQLYTDFFSKTSHTWWSNVKGINLIVPAPASFASDSSWPNLGLLIGREYYGINSRMNANANLFAGEGVAAAGSFGVLVIGALLALWLRTLDRAALGWNRAFVLVISAPMALCLTNSHLSTLLLSFGGFFWLAYLTWAKPKQAAAA